MRKLLIFFVALTIMFTIIWSYTGKEFNLYNYFLEVTQDISQVEKPSAPTFEWRDLNDYTNGSDDVIDVIIGFANFLIQPFRMIVDVLMWLFDWVGFVFRMISIIGGDLIL